MAETEYTDPTRGTIAYATSAKLGIRIQGVELSDDVLTINFTDSVSGTFDSETGTATIPITPGAQQAAQWSVTGRLSAGTGILENFQILTLENDTTPSDIRLFGQRTGDSNLVGVDVGNLPTGGGGEANLGNNIGGAGVDTFAGKVGVTLEFHRVEGTEVLESRLNGVPAVLEVGMKDTASGNIVGRALPGSGKPTFLIPIEVQTILADNNGRNLFQQYRDGPAQFTTDFNFVENTNGRTQSQINPNANSVEMTLPDATGLTGQDGWLADFFVASGAFPSSVTVVVPGQMEVQNGYGSFNPTADTQFFGLNQATALSSVYRLYKRGGKYIWQSGFFRNGETDDLTFDGPLQIVVVGGTPVNLSTQDHGGRMVELTNNGAMTLDVTGLTGPGTGVEVHKLLTGDATIVGGVGSSTIPSGEARLVRVRTGNIKYIS